VSLSVYLSLCACLQAATALWPNGTRFPTVRSSCRPTVRWCPVSSLSSDRWIFPPSHGARYLQLNRVREDRVVCPMTPREDGREPSNRWICSPSHGGRYLQLNWVGVGPGAVSGDPKRGQAGTKRSGVRTQIRPCPR